MAMTINGASQDAIIQAANLNDALAWDVFEAAKLEQGGYEASAKAVHAALDRFAATPNCSAYKALFNQVGDAYTKGRCIAALKITDDLYRSRILDKTGYKEDADASDRDIMRSKSHHAAYIAARAAWNYLVRTEGLPNPSKSAQTKNNANGKNGKKGARHETDKPTTVVTSVGDNGAQSEVAAHAGDLTFTKDVDGFEMLTKFAAQLSRASKQHSKGFKRGALLCAVDVIARIALMVAEDAGETPREVDESAELVDESAELVDESVELVDETPRETITLKGVTLAKSAKPVSRAEKAAKAGALVSSLVSAN